ncbi:MAG: AzlC family ABC transporter permease [Candidatus Binatia bacterium]
MVHSGSAFRDGATAAIPIWIAFVPYSFALGIAAKTHGLELEEIVLMSVLVYSGPAQFAVLEPLGSGKPALQILLATFLINLRFLVMSAALAPYFRGARRAAVLFCSHFVSASSFVLPYIRFQQQPASSSQYEGGGRNAEENLRYFLGVAMTSFAVWVMGSGLGYGVALSVPAGFEEVLRFVLPGYFACMLATELKGWTIWLIIVASFFTAVPGSLLSPVWGWLCTTLAVVTVCWGIEQWIRSGSR